ncbi:T9SS type A sorting domain-containing protein [Flavobacterium enshiense]|uniref:DUF7619 domain-containing protein n=1 Tax=Flavobacterium enshiense TaxID=1341165 RepID=UPI00345DEC1B
MIKKIFFSLFVIFLSTLAFGQCPSGSVTFYNQGQIDYFLTAYPNCTEINGSVVLDPANGSAITNLNGLRNITRINGSFRITQHNSLVGNLNGLENLTYIGGSIYINDTWISNISGIRNLTHVGGSLEIASNHISDFSPLNNITYIGGSLTLSNDTDTSNYSGLALRVTNIPGDLNYWLRTISDRDLHPLSALRSIGGNAAISVDNLTTLSGLDSLQTIGGSLNLTLNSQITNLQPLASLTSLGGLNIIGNTNSNVTSLSAFSQITSLNQGLFISGMAGLTSLAGLDNLSSVTGQLYISGNTNLGSINNLSGANLSGLTQLRISSNPNLTLCNELNVCNYLIGGGTYEIYGNGQGCNDFNQFIESCNTRWKNLIKGNIRIDYNANGCAPDDLPMPQAMVRATTLGNNVYYTFTNSNGDYRMFVPQGGYIVNPQYTPNNFNFTPLSSTVNFSGVGAQQTFDFCAVPSQIVNDVKIDFFPLDPARPGFDVFYRIKYTNSGTTIMSGAVNFTFDAGKMNFVNSSVPVASQNANVLTWNYTNLYPMQSGFITLKFTVLPPPIVNSLDRIPLSASISSLTTDQIPANNTFSMNHLVVNSYDPNDKTVLEGDMILYQDIDEYLHYVIRFQNTGTASAVNVKVVDTFVDKLDPTTIEIVEFSHSGSVQIKNNVAEFLFDNINLPDSTTDEPGSHGYISFKIKPNYNAYAGTTINNTANIYFDFNAPIITNTTATYVDADTDGDTILDSVDNCKTVSNTNQSDVDNDGFGDVCDDNIEVDPPYSIGFDTVSLDPLWKSYRQSSSYTNVTVSNLNDVDANGNTIRLYSNHIAYKAMLISPRLNAVSNTSTISFWVKDEGEVYNSIEIGFLRNPADVSTFTRLKYYNPSTTMTLYTLDMSGYNASYGKNLAILVKGNTVYVDDFSYTNSALSTEEQEYVSFSVYPNPVSNILTVDCKESFDSLTIYDINGRILRKLESGNERQLQIDVNDFSQGMYFLEAQADNRKKVIKFIKK